MDTKGIVRTRIAIPQTFIASFKVTFIRQFIYYTKLSANRIVNEVYLEYFIEMQVYLICTSFD